VDYRNNKYLTEARQLYDWLIRPLDSLFEAKKIDTLVFVPDDPLRSVPMGAFLDGKTFLIEKYAVAVSPGLTLIEPHRMDWKNASLFANGLSQAVPGFRALPAVDDEIKQITQSVPNNKTLKNEKFLKADFETVFEKGDFSVVHIASHGMFSGDVRKTFVLAYDKKLFLNAMEAMIRPKQLNDKPVEMLCLSACETAVGDERAALGLAGVAVKVGARSAFATLWCVEDNASSILISEFYRQLVGAKDSSKAMALRNAQMQLLAIPRYDRHPFYWAPYLIIGNWL